MSDSEVLAVIMGMMGMIFLVSFVLIVINIIGQWKTFSKANQPGWAAIIPIYNTYIACKIVGVNPWWIVIVILSPILVVIPIIGSLAEMALCIYFQVLLCVGMARSFGKSDGFAVGLFLLPIIFYLILGFDRSSYVGAKPMEDLLFDKILNQNK